ncbi:MAG TPA: diguanylate cyclase [Burkholderiaceae bacterium]|nr:diguanylate cyclase [Burkholderiaceae bacterium]
MNPLARRRSLLAYRWWLAALALCLAVAAAAAAAEPRRVADADADAAASVDLWPVVSVLSDPEHRLDAQAALARLADFRAPGAPHANLGPRHDTVWLRVPLTLPPGASGRWILDIDYPSLDLAEVHLVVGGAVRQRHLLGDAVPFVERPLPSHSHAVRLALEPGLDQELLIRVRSTSTMIVPLRLVSETRFLADQSRVQMAQGALAGIGLCLALYALFHAVTLKSAMFADYALAVSTTALFFFAFHGLAPQHLWPDSAWMSANAAPLLVLLAIVGSVRFVGTALRIRELSLRLHQAQVAVWGSALAACAALALGLIDYRVAQGAGTLLGVLCMCVTLPAALLRARRGDRAAWVVTAGWALYAVGAFTMAFLLRGVVAFDGWTEHAFQAGSAVEMLSWLLVLSMRMEEVRQSAHRVHAERDVMRSLAETDPLTGLPNRRGLRHRLESSLPACTPERLGAVYMVDLDGFKAVNDRLGHDAGDLLLMAVTKRLRRMVRAGDTVARLGGDEFVICADALPNAEEVHRLGEKMVAAFHLPVEIGGHACAVGLTVGYAIAPFDGRDPDALLKLADAALYAGKAAGKGRVLGAHQMRADSEGFRAGVTHATAA